jgi:hypothetical protein
MRNSSSKSDLLKILSVVATIPACFLLFSGGYVLARFAAAYTARDLLLYGVFPLVGGLCWLVLAAWFWSRGVEAKSIWDSLGIVSLRALGAIALAGIAVLASGKLRGH